MKAFILAAGEGTRMRPLTANQPKPLLPVAGKPFLVHALERLKAAGIGEVTILIGWRGRRIKEVLGHGEALGLTVDYEEQEVLEGTAAAVALAEAHVDDRFLCVNGDVVFGVQDVRALLDQHGESEATVVAVAEAERPDQFGAVRTEGDRLVAIEEKAARPPSSWVNAGLYLFNPSIFDGIRRTTKSDRGEFEVTDTLGLLRKKEVVLVHRLGGPWLDVGYPWDLLRANAVLLAEMDPTVDGEVEAGATLKGPVHVGPDALVRSGAYIEGPVFLDAESSVGPNCRIRPATYLGKGATIGNACDVKNSLIMDHSRVPHQNYVGDSVLGERCNLGAGTKVANLRLDERTIQVTVKGRRVDTGLRKLGAIIGDDVKTGINASIDVGTLIGEGAAIGPGALVRGSVAPGSRIY